MTTESETLVRPNIYQFRFGEFIITQILEGHVTRKDMHPFVATNATADEVQSVAREHYAPYPDLEHGFVCTVIKLSLIHI